MLSILIKVGLLLKLMLMASFSFSLDRPSQDSPSLDNFYTSLDQVQIRNSSNQKKSRLVFDLAELNELDAAGWIKVYENVDSSVPLILSKSWQEFYSNIKDREKVGLTKSVGQIDLLGGEYYIIIESIPRNIAFANLTYSWVDEFEATVYQGGKQLPFIETQKDSPQLKHERGSSDGLTKVMIPIYQAEIHESRHIVLRMKSRYFNRPPVLTLQTYSGQLSQSATFSRHVYFVSGVMFALLIYNLVLFWITRERNFFRYSVLMGILLISLPMYMQLYDSFLQLPQPVLSFFILTTHIAASAWFARGFLRLDEKNDWYNKISLFNIYLSLVAAIVLVLIPTNYAYFVGNILGVPILIFNVVAGIIDRF